ncbi:MAG: tRNA (adenosine(37)-N6)-threonylcarbamoyltransferase complex ATPase subunit type 1 TsaE, partial [Actinomycetota bacterium]
MSNDPDTSARTLRVASDGPERTQAFAAALAEVLVDGDLLVLTGDLGAGKTCFTQGLGAGLGIDDRITSPTFTLANRYRGRLILHHLDVYRLDGEADAADLDLDDLLESGVTVIEWGDRV